MTYSKPIEANDPNSFYLNRYRQLREELRQDMKDLDAFKYSGSDYGEYIFFNSHLLTKIKENLLTIREVIKVIEAK